MRGLGRRAAADGAGQPTAFRVFRTATPLKDPVTGELLGMEGQYVGQAELVRGESEAEDDSETLVANRRAAPPEQPAAGEPTGPPGHGRGARPGAAAGAGHHRRGRQQGGNARRRPPDPRAAARLPCHGMPHAPAVPVDARVVLVHGSSVRYAGQNQIVVINKGLRDGIENGHVLALLSTGTRIVDKTGTARARRSACRTSATAWRWCSARSSACPTLRW